MTVLTGACVGGDAARFLCAHQELLGRGTSARYRLAFMRIGAAKLFDKWAKSYRDLADDEITGDGYAAGGVPVEGMRTTRTDDREKFIATYAIEFDAVSTPLVGAWTEGAMLYDHKAHGQPAFAVYGFEVPLFLGMPYALHLHGWELPVPFDSAESLATFRDVDWLCASAKEGSVKFLDLVREPHSLPLKRVA
jgi:hypothetical protein